MTSSIARMNCFLHGIEDFRIERGDTLAEPKLVEGDRLQRFDVVLANPPYSIKQWNREAFAADSWGRNVFGVPPQGRADYAFQQHILQSLKPNTGRCAVLWPHGILFRNEEDDIRRKLIQSDYIEAVIGLGPNLFYNSSMQSCIVICRRNKAPKQKHKILFIDAVNEVTRERTQSFLTKANIDRVVQALRTFNTEEGFAKAATLDEVKDNLWSLNIPLYVQTAATKTLVQKDTGNTSVDAGLDSWLKSRSEVRNTLVNVFPSISHSFSPEKLKPDVAAALARFDRTKCKKATLGDVCDEISVRIDNPASSGHDRFVGLEHFESGDLKIRRWGSTENLESAMKLFSSGDVLFARRNAYLKRASLANFDGVCSGDAIVLRERHEAIVPGFLAFLLNTNRFWEFAIANAAGTMSRRVNGKTLMRFEFDLPPLDQQRRIAEILWAVDDSLVHQEALGSSLVEALGAARSAAVAHASDIEVATIEQVCEKIVDCPHTSPHFIESGVFVVRSFNIKKGELDLGKSFFTSEVEWSERVQRLVPKHRDLLFSREAPVGEACLVPADTKLSLGQRTMLLRSDTARVLPEYLLHVLYSPVVQREMLNLTTGTTVPHLNVKDVRNLKIGVPTIEEQTEVLVKLDALTDTVRAHSIGIERTRILQSTLINHLT